MPIPAHVAAAGDGWWCKYDRKTQFRVLQRAFAAERADKDVVETCVLRVAYRLTRELARTLNLIHNADALSSISFQSCSLRQPVPNHPNQVDSRTAFNLLEQIKHEGVTHFGVTKYDPANPSDDNSCVAGMALAPQSVHMNNALRKQFAQIMNALAWHLDIAYGAKDDPEYGRIALAHMDPQNLDPAAFPWSGWPDLAMLFVYEGLLVDDILETMIQNGQHRARRLLVEQHGFKPHEIAGLLKLAKLEARDRMEADIEEDRAILTIRLEELIERAKESLDLRVELGALKQLAIVQGVTRAEPEDPASAFVKVIKKVANEAQHHQPRQIIDQGA